jgi:Fic family protein
MQWNWQLSDWPQFRFDVDHIRAAEEQFLKGSGVVIGSLHHLDADARDGLTVELISQEVVDSSAIEGEILDRASVQSSLAKHLGFATDSRGASAAEAGAAELMADVYRNHAAPLDDQTLFTWHAMLINGRRDIANVGRYRTHEDAMQIVSGALHAPRVHFEAPPSDTVPMEISRFIGWLNDSAPSSPNPLPAITRAAISHLWFESIHPFEDGNGRIGRAIAEKALAQNLSAPTLTEGGTATAKRRGEHWNLQEKEEAERVEGQRFDRDHADFVIFGDGGDDRIAGLGQEQRLHEREHDQHQIVDAGPEPGEEIAARGFEQQRRHKQRPDDRQQSQREHI